MDARIAILTAHSLFADGLISRLRDSQEAVELKVFDRKNPDVLQGIAAFKPLALILEEREMEQSENCSFKQILALLPNLLIICLRLGSPEIQVIQSESCPANGVGELLNIIRLSSEHPFGATGNHAAAKPGVSV